MRLLCLRDRDKVPRELRIALFCDSFQELNGVGTVCREFVGYAERNGVTICCIRAGEETAIQQSRTVTTILLKRGLTFALDTDLYCDPFLTRHRQLVLGELRKFRPDCIHITGPGDMGTLGFWISNTLGVPMVASWHTNLHQYASRRTLNLLSGAPNALSARIAAKVEDASLTAVAAFYRLAHFVLAPNAETLELLRDRVRRPCFPMGHGVDPVRFNPLRRIKSQRFRIGSVGRLTPEKNVRALVDLENQLTAAGECNFEIVVIGDGCERGWLEKKMKQAVFAGFLCGDRLADEFAGMDVFVFPSLTDTFGLVVLEAMASGVPVVLNAEAGRRIGIRDGVEGFLVKNLSEGVLHLIRSQDLRRSMSIAAELFAREHSWDAVFNELYETYEVALNHPEVIRRTRKP